MKMKRVYVTVNLTNMFLGKKRRQLLPIYLYGQVCTTSEIERALKGKLSTNERLDSWEVSLES